MITVDDLLRLAPPPSAPVWATGDWEAVEAALGLGIPADFKALISHYGYGLFVDFIAPLTPFGERDLLRAEAERLLGREASFRREHPEKCPYPFHPEPGGLLPWAGLDNGARFCWLTVGEPDDWTVVAWNPRSWFYEHHAMGAVEFLHGLLSRQVVTETCGLFDDEDDDDPDEAGTPVFAPAWVP
ncbi:SMI1/KNR4 family protein [Streptacidiphilus rugosus]|uniref:SMI1/KNR4 family protein n=1 Tax=Streptacidiphilus rugosus TaxID=405783 RepID=UPI0006903CCC|nr:SMI1/KNR4 family protein [Streptacidiphilus rugosus]